MELKKARTFQIIFGIMVLLLVVTAFYSAANLNRVTNLTINLLNLQQVSEASENLISAMEEERVAIGQYQLSGEEGLLIRAEYASGLYDQNWDVIVEVLREEQQQAIYDIAVARSTYTDLLEEVISEYESNPESNRSAYRMTEAINYYLQYLSPKVEDLIRPEVEELSQATEIERTNARRNSFVAQIVLVLSVVVGITVTFFTYQSISYSTNLTLALTSIIDAANAISRGDLNRAIEIPEKAQAGEVGELAKSIDRMRTSLKAAIERLRS